MSDSRQATRVVWSAFIGSDNIGDEALFVAMLQNFCNEASKAMSIRVVSIDPPKTQNMIDRILRDNKLVAAEAIPRKKLPQSIFWSDRVVVGGGGIIQDESSSLNLYYFLLQIFFARMLRKQIALGFVGIGKINHSVNRRVAGVVLRGVALIIVRDAASKDLLNKCGVDSSKITVSSDAVLSIKSDLAHLKSKNQPSEPYIVLALRNWFIDEQPTVQLASKKAKAFSAPLQKYLRKIANALSVQLRSDEQLKVMAVPFFGERDVAIMEYVRLALPDDLQRKFIKVDEPTIDGYIALAADAKILIAMRLHAIILASTTDVPMVALSYSSKVRSFAESIGLEQVLDVSDAVREDQLKRAIEIEGGRHLKKKSRATSVAVLQLRNKDAFSKLVKFMQSDGY